MARHSVLVVDDDIALGEVLAEQIREWGCEAVAAQSARAAGELLRERSFGMVLSDLHMPPDGGDGYALLEHVRSHWPELPVVLMSSFPTPATAAQARRAGARGFLSKPFPAEELEATLRELKLLP